MTKEESSDAIEATKPVEKTTPASGRRPTKKKPKDKPKRPLSAYNYFFKEEREKILKVVLSEDGKAENDPDSEDYLDEDALGRLRKEGGKVSFEEMGKIIGQRWKNLPPDKLTKYSELAAEDTERYKKEMKTYNGRQEAKMRNEAHKPTPAYPGMDMKGPGVGGRSMPGYDMSGMGPAFGQPGMAGYGYPGMEFAGYPGMAMGGMYGYGGGYPGMGGGMPMGPEAMQGGMMGDAQGHQMYGMMGGGFQGGMGYGGGQFQGQMDPSQGGMYGYGAGQGWGGQ